MRNEKYRAGIVVDAVLEPANRRNVEVIGWFVEQQQVGLLHQRFGQCHAPAPAARQFIHLLIGRQVELGHRGFDALIDMPAIAGVNAGVQGFEVLHSVLVECQLRFFLVLGNQGLDIGESRSNDLVDWQVHRFGQVLGELADDEVRLPRDVARVEFNFPDDQFQRRGLTGAIAAKQANALA